MKYYLCDGVSGMGLEVNDDNHKQMTAIMYLKVQRFKGCKRILFAKK